VVTLYSEAIDSMEVRAGRERLRSDFIEEAFDRRRSFVKGVSQRGEVLALVSS
jgi:hypothetical protein